MGTGTCKVLGVCCGTEEAGPESGAAVRAQDSLAAMDGFPREDGLGLTSDER